MGAALQTLQTQMLKGRQEYGPTISSGRVSPSATQISTMMLDIDAIQPPLPPPDEVLTALDVMGSHYELFMKELSINNDEMS